MEVLRNPSDWPPAIRCGAVTIGNFDGVHWGHAELARRLLVAARRVGGPAVVFTFDPHPVRLLRPREAPPPLTWTDRKAQLLGELGVDYVVAYPTNEAFLKLSASEFFAEIVRGRLAARAMVEGENFYFGRDRAGDVALLGRLCQEAGIGLEVAPPVLVDGGISSSSRVRKALLAGRVEEANRLLTQPYRLRGMVTHGASRGNQLGFPTANLAAIDTLVPAPGVYAGRAITGGGVVPSAIHIGPNLTFGESGSKVEAHLIDWEGNLYGQPLEVDFLARLREIQRFDGVEALKQQLTTDIERARRILAS